MPAYRWLGIPAQPRDCPQRYQTGKPPANDQWDAQDIRFGCGRGMLKSLPRQLLLVYFWGQLHCAAGRVFLVNDLVCFLSGRKHVDGVTNALQNLELKELLLLCYAWVTRRL